MDVPAQHRQRFRAMQEDPALSYIITCAFLFYVIMCATLLDSLVGYNLRAYIQGSEKIKHALGLVVLIFTIGIVTNISNLWVVVGAGLGVYLWFLTMTKMPAQWNVLLLVLLMACFILNSLVQRIYTPSWVFSTSSDEDVNKREEKRESCIIAVNGIGIFILFLSMVMLIWFYSRRRYTNMHKAFLNSLTDDAKKQQYKNTSFQPNPDQQTKTLMYNYWKENWKKSPTTPGWAWLHQPLSEYIEPLKLWKGTDTQYHNRFSQEDIKAIKEALNR